MDTVRNIILYAPAVLLSIVLHEFMHGYVADKLGDPTPRRAGRLTLNPLNHIDPIGTIILPAFLLIVTRGQVVFGWAKPVPINPMNTLNPKRTMGLTAIAGPLTNFGLAVVCTIFLKIISFAGSLHIIGWIMKPIAIMFFGGLVINVVLFVFNFIPIPPLDGGRVLVWLLPDEQARAVARLEPYGMFIIFGMLFLDSRLNVNILVRMINTIISIFLWFA